MSPLRKIILFISHVAARRAHFFAPWCLGGSIFLVASVCRAQSEPLTPPDVTEIQNQLNSSSPAQLKSAMDRIKTSLTESSNARLLNNPNNFTNPLVQAKHPDQALELIDLGISRSAHTVSTLEVLLTQRVNILLDLGKTDEAIQSAKSLYNVCRLDSLYNVSNLLVKCLKAKDPALSFRFLKERAFSPVPGTILASISIDPAPYKEMLDQRDPATGGYNTLIARANLFLLTDKLDEAQKMVEAAYQVAQQSADDNFIQDAYDARARAWKALRGTQRARLFLLENKP